LVVANLTVEYNFPSEQNISAIPNEYSINNNQRNDIQPIVNISTNQPQPIVLQHAPEVEESLNIAEKEKELIIKALKKYKGRRRNAAIELGISERTLAEVHLDNKNSIFLSIDSY
jgi:DNA-binding NtrC family response regulator